MQRNYAELGQHNMKELEKVVEELCAPESYAAVYHRSKHDAPMPSTEALHELVERLKAALFPGYFGDKTVRLESMRFHLSANLDSIYRILEEQIKRGGCFICADFADECQSCEEHSRVTAMKFLQSLPTLRRLLATDVKAAFEGDPAAKTPGETIFCYPSMTAMIHHRIAHELYKLEVPIIPRIISEMAHSNTGIDIHPGAQIDEEFFIDHGTGVVIGETCIIGKGCRIYQGVTLGALSFPKDDEGLLVKGNLRHPILEDNVTVYAGATVLGRITIGHDTMIGGNVWITHDVEPNSKVIQSRSTKPKKEEKLVGEKA
ncbi:serine O-acetyltransferase EpsC [Halodesulfovibrio aestuarii]|uniref:Serine O-acetyltransferase n=1 Tax=Halodesulfovibrio aestuarii TaxID=126333 RepID=A0A8G2FB31_9BACT|nr:serine O-acetyltransferase EpsC [Halodesulfovibrio aestuarii]SHJ23219.1 serine O-acetyltransferase [Halodesulfovibrio aestuarii]